MRRLEKAFDAFFRRVKNGQEPGYPRFKGRNRYDSLTYPDGAGWKFDGQFLHLSKIGSAKVKLHRPLEGKIKTVTIKREVDQWYVTFSCEVAEPEKLPVSYEDVGIDLGVTHLATLSNGEMIEHPRDCGAELDRDVNAAINILARGKTHLARTEPTGQPVEAPCF